MEGERWVLVALAAGLAWLGARWTSELPHYEAQRRALPARTWLTVALATLAAGVALWQVESLVSQLFLALWSVVFALVTVVDYETHFIPDRIVLPATVAALLASFVDPRLTWRSALLGALLGFVFFYIVVRVARGGFGMGDAKLSAFIGAVTGALPLAYALLLGIFAGGIAALLLLLTRRATRRSYIPYGPFLCLGGWIGMLPSALAFWGIG